jgi:two-component sensor histidine kinase
MSDYLEDRRIVLSQGFYDYWKFAITYISQIADIIFEYNKNATLGKDKFQSQKSIKILPDTLNPMYKFHANMEEYNTLVGVHSLSQREFTARMNPGIHYSGISDLENMSFAKLIFQGYPLYVEATRHTEMLRRYTSTQYYMQPTIYQTLLNGCNNQEVRDFITNQYIFFSRIQRGNDMPVMELIGMDGKKMNWRRTRGKVVILMLYNDYPKDQKFCEKIFHLFGENKEDVIVLRISPGFDYNSWKEFNERNTDKGFHMFFTGEESAFRDRFLMIDTRYDTRYLIIGKDGKIFTNPGRNDVIRETDVALKEEAPPNEFLKALWSRILPGIVLGMILTFIFSRIIYRRRLAKQTLQRKMAELEQKAIKAQLNPHFLFNCLNSIQNLIRKGSKNDADSYLTKFAVLIRQVLKNSEKEEISISEELKGLELYLELEQMRFNFNYEILSDEKIDIHNVMIPPMLLHPVVENAILHGLDTKKGDKKLTIGIYESGESIQFLIEDNGVGRDPESTRDSSKESKGLKLMEARMEILRKSSREDYNFKITDKKDQYGNSAGTSVEILIPDEK